MAIYRFNKIDVDGTSVDPKDVVAGTGVIPIKDYLEVNVTLDHRVRRVKVTEKGTATVSLYGDWESLATQAVATDNDNFGGTHVFYLSTDSGDTALLTFDGLVDTKYNPEYRMTHLTFIGEFEGIT